MQGIQLDLGTRRPERSTPRRRQQSKTPKNETSRREGRGRLGRRGGPGSAPNQHGRAGGRSSYRTTGNAVVTGRRDGLPFQPQLPQRTTTMNEPNPNPLDALAGRVSSDPFSLASVLAAYQARHGLDDAGLAAVL